jgi:Spy/CpxP family protein refolding chaperone
MMRKRIFILGSGLLVIASLVFIFGFRGYHGGHGGFFHATPEERMEFFTDKIAKRLALDDAQIKQLQSMGQEVLEKRVEMHSWHDSISDTIHNEFLKDEVNKENIDKIVSESRQKIDEMLSLIASRMIQFHQMLTPEQRKKLVTAVEEHRESHRPYHKW